MDPKGHCRMSFMRCSGEGKAIGLEVRLAFHRSWPWEGCKHSGGILRRGQTVCISSVIVVRELTMKASLNYAFELIA